MTVRQYEAGKNIYLKSEVAVILAGVVIIRNHSKNPNGVDYAAKYQAGDIMGFADIDRGITSLSDSWNHCLS